MQLIKVMVGAGLGTIPNSSMAEANQNNTSDDYKRHLQKVMTEIKRQGRAGLG